MKKIFVVSDVHGHYSLLDDALKHAGFDRYNEEHLLVCCGDYFDRGDQNSEVLKYFERLKHKVLLRGNHEDMLLRLLYEGKMLPHHYINGTFNTLTNFFGRYFLDPATGKIDFSGQNRTVDRLCEFIKETVDYYETEHYVFVHGWLAENAFTEQARREADSDDWARARWLRWTEHYDGQRPLPDKTLICGHVPTFYAKKFDPSRGSEDASIFYGNGLIAIDAGTFDTKQVNVLVLVDS